jgi:hypothetical protein
LPSRVTSGRLFPTLNHVLRDGQAPHAGDDFRRHRPDREAGGVIAIGARTVARSVANLQQVAAKVKLPHFPADKK